MRDLRRHTSGGFLRPRASPDRSPSSSAEEQGIFGRKHDETIGALATLTAVAALALAAPAGANHTLGHKVQALTAKLNCLQKYPVFAFADYAYYDLTDPAVEVLDTGLPPSPVQVLFDNQEITALDFNYGPTMGQRRLPARRQEHQRLQVEVPDGTEPRVVRARRHEREDAAPPVATAAGAPSR